jgi:hypothetical protein
MQPDTAFQHHKHMSVMNAIVGGILFIALTYVLLCYSFRIWRSHRLQKTW